MPTLNAAQIASLAASAGWSGSDVATATAVALAESGGRTDAKGDMALRTGKWGPSVGLWQIRSLNAEKGRGSSRDEVANTDPGTNAKHAHQVWAEAGGKFRPWSTYVTGAYLLYLPQAKQAAGALVGAGAGSSGAGGGTFQSVNLLEDLGRIGKGGPLALPWTAPDALGLDIPDPLAAAGQGLSMAVKTGAWIANRDNWVRVVKVIVGSGMILAGGMRASSTVEKAVGAAQFAPPGRAFKAVT